MEATGDRVVIAPFELRHLPAVRAFSRLNWRRPESDAYFDWRYVRAQPFSRVFLALRGPTCVGMLFALRKRYRIDGEPTSTLEVFDWHSLPDVRGSGVGVRLMRAMMREPGWIVSVGGTEEVVSALTLMGWTTIGSTQPYEWVAPEAPAADGGNGHPHAEARGGGLMRALSSAVRREALKPPAGAVVSRVERLGDDVLDLYASHTGYGMVQEPDPDVLAWITGSAWNGRYDVLTFRVGSQVRGWALTRLYDWGYGLDGDLIDCFARGDDAGAYRWMVGEALASLAEARPRRVRARASCPALRAALVANGFVTLGPPTPILVRAGERAIGSGPVHITMNHADGPLLPYETDARLRARAAHGVAGAGRGRITPAVSSRRDVVRPPSAASTPGSRP
jgi:hypothetical protein